MTPQESVLLLAMAASLLLVAPFSRLAAVVVILWFLGEAAYRLGAPETAVNLVQHFAALVVGSAALRTWKCIAAWALLVPMLAVDLFLVFGVVDGGLGFWLVWSMALAQLGIVPFGMDMEQRRLTLAAWRRSRSGNGYLMVTA